MAFVHISNGTRFHGTERNLYGLHPEFATIALVEQNLEPMCERIQDAGHVPTLNWLWGHSDMGHHSYLAYERLRADGEQGYHERGYADALLDLVFRLAGRGRVQLWLGVRNFDAVGFAERLARAGVELVFDAASALPNGDRRVGLIEHVRRLSVRAPMVEQFWGGFLGRAGREWQNEYDCIGNTETFASWRNRGGRIPATQTAFIMDYNDEDRYRLGRTPAGVERVVWWRYQAGMRRLGLDAGK